MFPSLWLLLESRASRVGELEIGGPNFAFHCLSLVSPCVMFPSEKAGNVLLGVSYIHSFPLADRLGSSTRLSWKFHYSTFLKCTRYCWAPFLNTGFETRVVFVLLCFTFPLIFLPG